jgi:hypothetical protein
VSDRLRLPDRADVVEKSLRSGMVACSDGCVEFKVGEIVLKRIGDGARARAEKDCVKCSMGDRGDVVCDELSRGVVLCDIEAEDVGALRSVAKAL